MSHELERAHRTGGQLVLAFLDVDGLKAVNDSEGHLAGDALLRLVGDTIRANVRSYDVIVRYGGDEFVCALVDASIESAAERFLRVNAELGSGQRASISVGLAELSERDSLDDLIARADAALRTQRQHRSPSR